jgi:hypothetical protein
MAVSLLKPPNGSFRSETTVRSLHGRFESGTEKFNGYKFNGHPPTDASVRSGVTVMYSNGRGRWSKPTAFILVSESSPGINSAFSKAVKCTKGSKPDLGHWCMYQHIGVLGNLCSTYVLSTGTTRIPARGAVSENSQPLPVPGYNIHCQRRQS